MFPPVFNYLATPRSRRAGEKTELGMFADFKMVAQPEESEVVHGECLAIRERALSPESPRARQW